MIADSVVPEDQAHAWNPGLQSDIPSDLWPRVTLFREENATVSHSLARELSDLTGLKILELIALRPERLVIHALLVRVTADLSVPDGPNYEDLGINLRGMVHTVYSKYVSNALPGIVQSFESELDKARAFVDEQLATPEDKADTAQTSNRGKPSLWRRLLGETSQPVIPVSDESADLRRIESWKRAEQTESDALRRVCFKSLVRTCEAIVGHRGRLLTDADLISRIVVNQVGNDHGADCVDTLIEPHWRRAIECEGYRELPAQAKPVVMNVKGASAAGKSTIRPRQRELAAKLDIPWEDFALISPDYWRKYLLEYSSLGENYKYGAMLTGRELEIIDRKLDRYMADKARKQTISHMLIDRFRFDSFSTRVDRASSSRLLSRFGDRVYLFFMVTHPAETVQRAWARGLTTGRFKAVDDLLYHNVEAFTGMPSLFLSWVKAGDKQIHFEFLDNDVPKGELPKTAAFGWNQSLTILDIDLLLNIDRYRQVNIAATEPQQIFAKSDLKPAANLEFIAECRKRVPEILFADQESADIYARVSDGKLVWCDRDYVNAHRQREGLLEVLGALGYGDDGADVEAGEPPSALDVAAEKRVTVGRWNDRCSTTVAPG